MSAASRFFFERKLVYPFAFVSFAVDFCLCIVLFLKSGFYFSLRNKVGFPLSHPFSPLLWGEQCLPSYTASAPIYRIIFLSAPSPLSRIPYLPATLVPYRNPPRRGAVTRPTRSASLGRRGAQCAPAAQTTAALFREGSPHGKRAQAHTVRPCSPRMPVPFPPSRLSFKKNSARCASSAWHKTPLLNRLIFIKNVFLSYCPLLQTNFLSPKNRLSFSSFL